MDISTRKITSEKVRDSKVDFLTIGSYIEKNTWVKGWNEDRMKLLYFLNKGQC